MKAQLVLLLVSAALVGPRARADDEFAVALKEGQTSPFSENSAQPDPAAGDPVLLEKRKKLFQAITELDGDERGARKIVKEWMDSGVGAEALARIVETRLRDDMTVEARAAIHLVIAKARYAALEGSLPCASRAGGVGKPADRAKVLIRALAYLQAGLPRGGMLFAGALPRESLERLSDAITGKNPAAQSALEAGMARVYELEEGLRSLVAKRRLARGTDVESLCDALADLESGTVEVRQQAVRELARHTLSELDALNTLKRVTTRAAMDARTKRLDAEFAQEPQ